MFHRAKNASFDPKQLQRHKLRNRIWRDPYLDWIIIFIVFVVLSAFAVVSGTSTYSSVKEDIESSAIAPIITPAVMDTELLTIVLDRFEERAKERAELQRSYRYTSDPSN